MVAMLLIEDVLTFLMMLKDCCQSRSAIAMLLSASCHNCHCRIAFCIVVVAVALVFAADAVFRCHFEGRLSWRQ